MGALRLWLALCVVADHAWGLPFPLQSGTEAVQVFFLVSGFNMSFLRDRYPGTGAFLRSRFLRIFVPAWTVLAVVGFGSVASGILRGRWGALEPWGSALRLNGWWGAVPAAIANISIVGQDALLFLSSTPAAGLRACGDFWRDPAPLHRLLLMPQMWSVSLEIVFYLLVPFLWRWTPRRLLLLAAVAAAARAASYAFLGLGRDPWDNRFLPFEIGLFALGMAAQRGFRPPRLPLPHRFLPRTAILAAAMLVAAWAHRLLDLRWGAHWTAFLFLPLWAWVLPGLFQATRDCPRDRMLGELSYPIYLVHMAAIGFASHAPASTKTLAAIALSLVFAEVLRRGVERPLDGIRARWRKPDRSRDVQAGTDLP